MTIAAPARRLGPAPGPDHRVRRPGRAAPCSAASGVVSFAPMRTTGLTFSFTPVQAPLQITDVVIPGVPFVSTPSGPFRLRVRPRAADRAEREGRCATRVSGTLRRPAHRPAAAVHGLLPGHARRQAPTAWSSPRRTPFSVQDRGGQRADCRAATARVRTDQAAGVVSWTSHPRAAAGQCRDGRPTWSSTRTSTRGGRRSSTAGSCGRSGSTGGSRPGCCPLVPAASCT